MKSKASVFCNETCIVVDHNQSFLNPSGSKINLDPVQKRSAKDSFLHGLAKSTWTCVVEGISEYCRIVFDLFDTTCKVNTVPFCFINSFCPCLKLILFLAKFSLLFIFLKKSRSMSFWFKVFVWVLSKEGGFCQTGEGLELLLFFEIDQFGDWKDERRTEDYRL